MQTPGAERGLFKLDDMGCDYKFNYLFMCEKNILFPKTDPSALAHGVCGTHDPSKYICFSFKNNHLSGKCSACDVHIRSFCLTNKVSLFQMSYSRYNNLFTLTNHFFTFFIRSYSYIKIRINISHLFVRIRSDYKHACKKMIDFETWDFLSLNDIDMVYKILIWCKRYW